MDLFKGAIDSEPTLCDQEKIDLLSCYPGVKVAEEPAPIPPGFQWARLAQQHGWQVDTVKKTARRWAGRTSKPAHYNQSWLICAAISLELGGQICWGMARDIAELQSMWADLIADQAAELAQPRRRRA